MEKQELRIIKKLPQIVLPADKNEMFLKWYDEDLRFQDIIPKAFERGYVFIENTFMDIERLDFSQVAKKFKTTYRAVENTYKEFMQSVGKATVYFEFKDNFLNLEIYGTEHLIGTLNLDLTKTDESKPNPPIVDKIKELIKNSTFIDCFSYYCFVLLQCCLWYISTTTNTTKYYREGNAEPYYHEVKTIINPKKNKTISTPIYDMGKIRKVKVEGLIKRRKRMDIQP